MKYKILLFLSCLILNACATKVKPEQVNMCPPCAVAGPKVAKELEKVCDEKKCPNTIDWINRHAKVCDILTEMSKH